MIAVRSVGSMPTDLAQPRNASLAKLPGETVLTRIPSGASDCDKFLVMLVTIGRIAVDGERATARSYISEAYPRGDQVGRDRGVFEDELVFRDGRWLFKKRTFRYLSRA